MSDGSDHEWVRTAQDRSRQGGIMVVVGSVFGLAVSIEAQTADGNGSRAVHVEPTAVEMRIDGVLDEPAWTSAERVGLEWEVRPGDNVEVRVSTACWLTYDASQVYFACEASDPVPGEIRAFLTDRDKTDGNDRIFLALDPFADSRRAFEFGVTPLGVQHDRLRTESAAMGSGSGERGVEDAWDAIWESAGRITSSGYVIEAAVPFRSLRFPESSESATWRFSFAREWPRGARYEMRSHPWDRANACLLCQSNLMEGIAGVAPGMNLEVNPTVVANRQDEREPDTAVLASGATEVAPSLDVRWSPATNLALNLTLNPDYSQIEADAVQLQANVRFPLQFAEKRPFFLEGADLFETPMQVVFTRRLVDPVAGVKLSGKLGATAGGLLVAHDDVTNLTLPAHFSASDVMLASSHTTLLARVRRDIGASSNIGAVYTGRIGNGYTNHVAGVDALFRPFRSATARVQVLRSATEYPESAAAANDLRDGLFHGYASHTSLRFQTRDWNGELLFNQIEPGFRGDAGFMTQVNVRELNVWGGRTVWADRPGWYTRLATNLGLWRSADFDGNVSNEGYWMNVEYDGPLQTMLWVNPNYVRQVWQDSRHEMVQLWAGGSMQPSGGLQLTVTSAFGDAVDFLNDIKATQVRIVPRVSLRAGRHLDVELGHSLQRLSHDGVRLLDASVSELRTVYNFTTRAFARAIVQYRDTKRPPAAQRVAVPARQRRLDVQLLFSYKLNPLTVFFVGYGEGRDGETTAASVVRELAPLQRAFFIKLGYAWRP